MPRARARGRSSRVGRATLVPQQTCEVPPSIRSMTIVYVPSSSMKWSITLTTRGWSRWASSRASISNWPRCPLRASAPGPPACRSPVHALDRPRPRPRTQCVPRSRRDRCGGPDPSALSVARARCGPPYPRGSRLPRAGLPGIRSPDDGGRPRTTARSRVARRCSGGDSRRSSSAPTAAASCVSPVPAWLPDTSRFGARRTAGSCEAVDSEDCSSTASA